MENNTKNFTDIHNSVINKDSNNNNSGTIENISISVEPKESEEIIRKFLKLMKYNLDGNYDKVLDSVKRRAKFLLDFNNCEKIFGSTHPYFHIILENYAKMTLQQQAGFSMISANIIVNNPTCPYGYLTETEDKLINTLRSLSVKDNQDIADYIQTKINAKNENK